MISQPNCCPTCGHKLEAPTKEVFLDRKTNTVLTKIGTAKLSPTLAEFAELLIENVPHYVSNERIYMRLWGCHGISVSDASIISQVKRLRTALEPIGLFIENRSRVGYRIIIPHEMSASDEANIQELRNTKWLA